MTVAYIAGSGSARADDTTSSVTTATGHSTAGADFIFIAASHHSGGDPVPSDLVGGNSNIWNANGSPTTEQQGNVPYTRLHWSIPTHVGADHQGTLAASNSFPGICFGGFSGVKQTNPLDSTAPVRNVGTGASIKPANGTPQTPSMDGCLSLLWVGYNGTQGFTDPSGYTLIGHMGLTTGYGIAAWYKIQTTATAEDPTIALTSGSQDLNCGMAFFQPAAGGGGGLFVNPLNGIGGGAAMPIA